MKIGLIGDAHLHNFQQFEQAVRDGSGGTYAGVNARAGRTARALEKALRVLREAGCKFAVQLGDLFEKPDPGVAVMAMATRAALHASMDLRCIIGNHDAYTTPATYDDSAFAGFLSNSSVGMAWGDARLVDGRLIQSFGSVADRKFHSEYRGQTSFIHAGLYSEKEPVPLMAGKHDLCVERDLWGVRLHRDHNDEPHSIVAAGHWHHARHFGARDGIQVLQAGVLHPTGFGDDGWESVGWVYAFDDETGKLDAFQVEGLRFINVRETWQGILDLRMAFALGNLPLAAVHAETVKEATKMRDELYELFGKGKPYPEGARNQEGLSDETCVLRIHPPDRPAEFTQANLQSKEAYAKRAAARMPVVEDAERGRLTQRILAHWKD